MIPRGKCPRVTIKGSLIRRGVGAVQLLLLLCVVTAGQASGWKALPGCLPPPVAADAQPAGTLPDETRLDLAICLPLRNKEALAELLREIYTPGSQRFHQYLTSADFAARFSPSPRDYQAVIDFANASHFKVTGLHPNRTLLDASASSADICRVFRVNMKVYGHPTENRTFFAPDADPVIEADLPILGIKGLNDFDQPHSEVKTTPLPPVGPNALAGSGPGGAYIGGDFRSAYAPGVTLTGTGQTVAVVEFDGYYPSDIASYERAAYPKLAAVPLTNVLVGGYDGSAGANNSEVALDIEAAISMAPNLSGILVYEEPVFNPVDDILNRIATDNLASQISCSWNFPNFDAVTDQIFQQFAAQGQSFFCASGDNGAYVAGQVRSPANDPYITVVGGTTLSTVGTNGPWQSETAWSRSGGGFATNYAIPDWQVGVSMIANQGSTAFRNSPDVAMCATNVFAIYNNGVSHALWGTSCAAPLWAGFTALINEQAALYGNPPAGFLNPALYAIGTSPGYATNFHDIVTGNNTNSPSPKLYFAVPGYDLCTGWGTPNGSNLINTLAPPDTLLMLPVPGFASSGAAGGPFSVTSESFTLTNTGATSLAWSLGIDSLWLSASLTNGNLVPGGTAAIVGSLNLAASNLMIGHYTANLTLSNLSTGLTHRRRFTLSVADPLALSPAAGFTLGGPPSGPFNLAAETCWLNNASDAPVSWLVVSSPPWLSVWPSNGTLAPFSAVAVDCKLNAAATNLPAASYSGSVVLSNVTFGAQESVPFVFLIGDLILNGGFETGAFTGWTFTGNTNSTQVSTDSVCVHSGSFGAELGASGSLGYFSQTLPTVPGQMYSVSLWLDSPDGQTPNEFLVSWGGNTLCDYTNLAAIGWTNLQFSVTASNAATMLEVGFRDDPSYLGLDDISVAAAPPGISAVTPASGPATGGTVVTIAGVGFQNQATVSFGSIAAASVTVNSTSNVTAVTPAWPAGPVNVTVINADGQSAVLTNGFIFVGTPVITWTNPPALTYGAALGAGQLNAIASVPGAFVYDPPAGAVLNAGTNLLAAVFTPNDTTDYYSATDFVSMVVSPAPLSVTASNASRIYGVANPPFTGAIAGLENGDNITASFNCNATPASPAGTYQIVPSLTDTNNRLPNYEVSIIDGVLTIAAPAPTVLQSATQTSNMITFSWSTTSGEIYQVQYNSSLTAANWADLGGPVTATNTVLTASDSLTNGQRYYRVLLTPQ